MWLRAFGRQTPVTFQTDWGQEFGGDNPDQVQQLSRQFLQPLGGQLKRYPKGRKGYNGRVERSHRTDDEEFYRPYVLNIGDAKDFLAFSQRRIYFCNALRPHFGDGMNSRTPLTVLQSLCYTGQQAIVAFPPLLLDRISTDLLMACDPEDGNDLLAHYTVGATPVAGPSCKRPTHLLPSTGCPWLVLSR